MEQSQRTVYEQGSGESGYDRWKQRLSRQVDRSSRPKWMRKSGGFKFNYEAKLMKDEMFVRALEAGSTLEGAAFMVTEDARKDALARSGKIMLKDCYDMGYFGREVTGSKSLHNIALNRLNKLPVELKRRVLEVAPKALAKMESLVEATKPIIKDGEIVGEYNDNETQYKASKDLLDRTLGKASETLKIQQEVSQLNINVEAEAKLSEEFTQFLKEKHGKKAEAFDV